MKATTYLISYQPYPTRDERCCIGALVFDEDSRSKLHLASNLRKLKAIDPACSVQAVRDEVRNLTDQLNSNKSIWLAIKSGFGSIRFSHDPGFFVYQDEADYNKQVHALLQIMVEPRRRNNAKERMLKSRLFLDLKHTFDQFGWLAKNLKEIDDHKVVTHYPLSEHEQLFAEFAMKNGKLHVVETIDFRTGPSSAKRIEAQGKALVMDFAKDLSHETVCTAIVASSDYESIRPSMTMLGRYADRVLSFNSSSDMNEFFGDWGRLLGKPLLPVPPIN